MLIPDDVIPHDQAGARVAQICQGAEAKLLERDPVGVKKVAVTVADRDGIGQGTDDHVEAALGSSQSTAQLREQALVLTLTLLALADIEDECVKAPVAR